MSVMKKIPIYYISTLSVLKPNLLEKVEENEISKLNQSPSLTGF
jgi:hypothetical protein